eukprot:1722779-Prymnesium_polylepis.1
MSAPLLEVHARLAAAAASDFEQLRAEHDSLRPVELSSAALKAFVGGLPRDVDQRFFWRVMTCVAPHPACPLPHLPHAPFTSPPPHPARPPPHATRPATRPHVRAVTIVPPCTYGGVATAS